MAGDQEAGAFCPRRSPMCQALGGKGGERDRHECCGRDRDGGHGALHLTDLRKGVGGLDATDGFALGSTFTKFMIFSL